MAKSRVLVLVFSAARILATFLPWVNAPIIGSIPGSAGDGWFTFGLFLIAMLFGIAGDRSKPLSTGALIGVNVVALLACALGVWKILDFGLKMDEVSGNAGGLGRAIIGTA